MKKPNSLIAVLLAVALLFINSNPIKAAPKPDGKVWEYLICAALVVGVGAVVVVGLKKICSKLPTPPPTDPPPPPPPTNPPPILNPTNAPPTNPPTKPWYKKILSLTDANANAYDISGYAIPDRYAPAGADYKTIVSMTLQSSTNLVDWGEEFSLTQWVSDYGMFNAYYRGGSNLLNTYSGLGVTNYVPLDIGSGDEPKKFFRMR
jgi:hypothetical protein